MIIATVDWKVLTVVGVLILVAMILGSRLLSRDRDVRRTRYGFFVERDRFDQEEPWPQFPPPPETRSLPLWADQEKTVELPPEEEKK